MVSKKREQQSNTNSVFSSQIEPALETGADSNFKRSEMFQFPDEDDSEDPF